jgi:exodeoxyribonuclease-3
MARKLRLAKLKIATFNINNINARLAHLLHWLKAAKPDVVCLQELKAEQEQFPIDAINDVGYHGVWVGQKTWNGVAILAKRPPVVIRTRLPGDPKDQQSRYLEVAINGIVIACIYAPNGNPQPGRKFSYKLAWMKRLSSHAAKLLKSGVPVVLAGDFNVAPTELDIYPSKSWKDDALVHPESRKAYAKLLKLGWNDALRIQFPDERIYTFWTYWRQRYERDHGLRLDHLLLSPGLEGRLKSAGVDRGVRGKPGASDHAPAWIIL